MNINEIHKATTKLIIEFVAVVAELTSPHLPAMTLYFVSEFVAMYKRIE